MSFFVDAYQREIEEEREKRISMEIKLEENSSKFVKKSFNTNPRAAVPCFIYTPQLSTLKKILSKYSGRNCFLNKKICFLCD